MRGVGDKSEWTAGRRGSRRGPRTSLCPSVTHYHSMGIVTLSIVNYMIHRSNGRAFERAIQTPRRGKSKPAPLNFTRVRHPNASSRNRGYHALLICDL